jgi:hypothetical protein
MSSKEITTKQILTTLADAPLRLTTFAAKLTPTQLQTAHAQGEWSANAVLAHLRSCADVWGSCIVKILAEDRPTLRAINPTTWIKRTNYLELEFQTSLDAFIAQRTELLTFLESLPTEAWLRSAQVTGTGAVRERTVFFYMQWLARHERQHFKQLENILDFYITTKNTTKD